MMRWTILMGLIITLACNSAEVEEKKKVAKGSMEIAKEVALVEDIVPEIDTSVTIDYLMGKFVPAKDPRFTKVSGTHASTTSMLLRKETYEAFKEMYTAAKKEGISLKVISATRPFAHQKRIWEAKWNGTRKVDGQNLSKTHPDIAKRALKILEFSSMPGSSRHHWGTDIDINALTNEYFEKGKGKKEYDWLVANAPKYGFCQPYSPKDKVRPDGYNEEKWHWSFLPISKNLTEQYQLRIKNETVTGFAGSEAATRIDIVKHYVLGINQDCL